MADKAKGSKEQGEPPAGFFGEVVEVVLKGCTALAGDYAAFYVRPTDDQAAFVEWLMAPGWSIEDRGDVWVGAGNKRMVTWNKKYTPTRDSFLMRLQYVA